MEVLIRNAKKEEAALLAQIEAECFPAAEAAGKQDIEARMDVFEDCFLWLRQMERSWDLSTELWQKRRLCRIRCTTTHPYMIRTELIRQSSGWMFFRHIGETALQEGSWRG